MKELKTFSDCEELLAERSQEVFAVGNTVYHGLGVAELSPQSPVVAIDDDDLSRVVGKSESDVFSLEERLDRQNIIFRNTAKLLAQEKVISFLDSKSENPQLYISKPSKRLEVMAEKNGWSLLAATSELNKLFEDKVSFAKLMAAEGGDEVPREICKIEQARLEQLGQKFGWPIVVQFSRGLAGAGTFIVEKDEVPEFTAQHEDREGVVAQKLAGKGRIITLNACVIPQGVVTGAPFLQITGIDYLNKNEGGTCGNDYGVDLAIDSKQRHQVFEETMRLGEMMREKGYLGLFGIDFIVGEKVWVVEINARPTASVPTYTQGEHERKEVSLLGLHLLVDLGIPFDIDLAEINAQKFGAVQKGSKVIFRNTTDTEMTARQEFAAGVYKIDDAGNLIFDRPASSVAALQGEKEALLWSVKSGKKVNPNIELVTLILSTSATDSKGELTKEVDNISRKIKAKLDGDVA